MGIGAIRWFNDPRDIRPRGWSRTRREQASYMRRYRKSQSFEARLVRAIMDEIRPAVEQAVREALR